MSEQGSNQNSLDVSLAELLQDPCWLAYRANTKQGVMEYLHVTRQQLQQAPFHDERFGAWVDDRVLTIRMDAIQGHVNQIESASPSPAALFHTAFCCSTLMARVIEAVVGTYALREPLLLRDVLNTHENTQNWHDRARLSFALLSVVPEGYRRVLIKPSNLALPLFYWVREWHSHMNLVVLTSSLESFLVSVLKKEPETQAKMRDLAHYFLAYLGMTNRFDLTAGMLEQAALTWVAQRTLLLHLAPDRRWIDAERLLERDPQVIKSVLQSLGFPNDNAVTQAVLDSQLWSQHAKATGLEYTATTKSDEDAQIRRKYRDEINAAMEWVEEHFADLPTEPASGVWL